MTADPEIGELDLRSLTHELAPWQVERDALVLTDHSYLLGFECRPLETDGLSVTELGTLARRAQAWLHALPDGEYMRLVHETAPEAETIGATASHAACTQTLTGVLAELRDARLEALRAQGARGDLLRTRLVVFVSYHPRRLRPPNRYAIAAVAAGLGGVLIAAVAGWQIGLGSALAGFGALTFLLPRRPGSMGPRLRADYEYDHRVLRGLRDTMLAHLAAMGLAPRSLTPAEYLEVPWRYSHPRLAGGGVAPPPLPGPLYELTKADMEAAPWALPVSLRQLIAGSDCDRTPSYLLKDGRSIGVLAMDVLPTGSTIMLQLLDLLRSHQPQTTVLDIAKPHGPELMSKLTARASLTANIRDSQLSEAATMSAARQHEGLWQILWRVFGGETQVLSLGLAAVLARRTPEDLERASLDTHRLAAKAGGITLVDETTALAPQWRRLMPASGATNRRMRMVLSENAVHLLPLSGAWAGSPRAEALFRNRWGGITAIDLFDERASAWNGVVAGTTGSGKTAFVCQLLLQVLRPQVRAIIIDKGMNEPPSSYLTLTRLLDGGEIVFDLTGRTAINPFDIEPAQRAYFLGEAEDPTGHATAKLQFLVTLVDHLVSPRSGPHLTEEEKGLVGEAIVQTYRRRGDEPTFLHHFVEVLRNLGPIAGHEPSAEQRRAMESIAARLFQWVERGRYAPLLDRPTNVHLDRPVTYVDLAPLSGNADLMGVAVLLVQDLVYRHAMRQIGVQRTIVVQDELWSVLADRTAAKFLDDMYRRFRHVGASVLSVSQNLRDFQSDDARAILSNAAFWFLLAQGDIAAATEIAGLNERQVKLVAGLQGRPGEYAEVMALMRLSDHTETGVLRVVPTSAEFWVAASHAHERLLREKYIHEAGTVWAGIQQLARDHPRGTDLAGRRAL